MIPGLARLRRWLASPHETAAAEAARAREDGERRKLREQIRELSKAVDQQHKSLASLQRQTAELRGLLHQQADFTVEALRRAGWQSDEDAAKQAALQRALGVVKTDKDVIVGPWTGEVGFELMYWIPFLTWLAEQGLDGRRMVVISRGGAAPWYRHLTTRYVDLLDLVTPDEFRTRTAGPKKQFDKRREFEQEIVKQVIRSLDVPQPEVVHPSVMYRLFAGLWRKRATLDLVEAFTSYRELTIPAAEPANETPRGLPADYLVAKFYFSKAFPETQENRAFMVDLLARLSRRTPVVLLSTAVELDEHHDFRIAGDSGLFVVDAHAVPRKNLELQTRIICGARGFIGTYGGFSYLAPFYGVRSLSFFSERTKFESHHLELAERVFSRLRPGAFLALDRRAMEVVEPAVERWTHHEAVHS